ncbi:MAG: hypothetical protein A2020_10305 [Lentisphaerae bacterium GWF2_45_14]|nr:MAG: hypothetical protein A2020_10305 [Lentisphaerae bacterium GWF2_45_14]
MKKIFVLFSVFLFCLSSTAVFAAKNKKNESLKVKLTNIYKEITDIKLSPWNHEPSTVITEMDAKTYKIIRPGGSIDFTDEKPADDQNIEKIYVRQNPSGFSFVMTDKGRQFVWQRLYWDPKLKNWQPSDTKYSDFIIQNQKIKNFLRTLNMYYNQDAGYRLPIVVFTLPQAKPPQQEEYRKEMKELCEKIAGLWGGTEMLNKFYEIEIEKNKTPLPEEKVKLTGEQVKILEQILKKIKPLPTKK